MRNCEIIRKFPFVNDGYITVLHDRRAWSLYYYCHTNRKHGGFHVIRIENGLAAIIFAVIIVCRCRVTWCVNILIKPLVFEFFIWDVSVERNVHECYASAQCNIVHQFMFSSFQCFWPYYIIQAAPELSPLNQSRSSLGTLELLIRSRITQAKNLKSKYDIHQNKSWEYCLRMEIGNTFQ